MKHPYLITLCLGLSFALLGLSVSACGGGDAGPEAQDTPLEEGLSAEVDAGRSERGGGAEGNDVALAPPVEGYGLEVIDIGIDPELLESMHSNFDDDITATVSVTMQGVVRSGVEFELHGGHARTLPKKTYRLVFPDDDKPVVDWFGEGPETQRRVVLQANWIDPSAMRNKLTFDLIRSLGGLAPRVGYCVLSINGEWHGLYSLVERIDKPYLGRQGLDKDGNLYKAENHLANWDHKADPLDGFDVEINEDNSNDDLGELLEALTYTPQNLADFQAEVEPLLSLEDFHLWQQVHVFALNRDTFTKNYYLYHDIDEAPEDPKSRFRIVSWDADATFGLNWDGQWLDTNEVSWHGSDTFSQRLYSIPAYKSAYIEAFESALSGALSPPSIATRVASTTSRIRSAAIADLERWGRDDIDYDGAVETLNQAVTERHTVMSAVLSEL